MRLTYFLEDLAYKFVHLPLELTDDSSKKHIRIAGVLWFSVWFFPAMLIVIVIGGLLAIPAMIYDA